jgi:hypothetical protein
MEFLIEITPDDLPGLLEKDIEATTKELMQDLAKFLPTEARAVIDESSAGGKLYPRSSRTGFKRFHQASAKGQAPAKDSFELYNSFKATMGGDLSVTFEMAGHAAFLDPLIGGSFNRPFIEPAFIKVLKQIQ